VLVQAVLVVVLHQQRSLVVMVAVQFLDLSLQVVVGTVDGVQMVDQHLMVVLVVEQLVAVLLQMEDQEILQHFIHFKVEMVDQLLRLRLVEPVAAVVVVELVQQVVMFL
jgi:hypothetical protein